jgi:hypothetical protein
VLEDAGRGLGRKRLRPHAVRVRDDELAGLDVAQVLGGDEVERARLRGDDRGFVQPV